MIRPMRSAKVRLLVAVLAGVGAAATGSGCGTADPGLMVAIPPPRDWERRLADHRAAKDDSFRTSPQTPLLPEQVAGFAGLEYWPPRRDLHFVGPIHGYVAPEPTVIATTAGGERPAEKFGFVRFRLGGRVQTLQVYRLLDRDPREGVEGLFLGFYDETSGKETYPAGRYIEFLGRAGGPYILDFNLAFNPSCAYGAPERFACPLAPRENRLSLRIEAGERGYHRPPEASAATGS